ncbi:TIGR00341 family protein [Haladaptatus sp. T7]|uniref:TIGR00341 family protein n=1 Tax=Haladaptatus sp. T7 TaxID=2029368 RepID=UPI0021A25A35|nr:TIGR00341 family protein [Haladaptatus sp. T7]GKZ14169.1 TIGR00341 family protein [Haladaptatus sp. T7]
MRLVQVSIPTGERETVVETLDSEGIDFFLTDETGGRRYTAIATFPLPQNAVQPVIDKLHDAGLSDEAHTVIIDAETDTSRQFEQLAKRYEAENGADRIARDEILTAARELSPRLRTFVFMTVVSAVVATAGLLLDSPAVVVGSMVIAPLVGPALSAGVGTVLDESALFTRGVKLQLLGVTVAIASATLFAFFVRVLYLFPPNTDITAISQISGRLTPDFLSLIVALGAGSAGVISLAAGVSVALVGVMIAAALIPPAAAVGIGIAWGSPVVALSAGVLVLVNVLSINLSAIVTLQYMGYRPKNWFKLERSREEAIKRIGALVVALAVLSVFLGGVTYFSYQGAQFEQGADRAVTNVFEQPRYQQAERLQMQVQYRQTFPLGKTTYTRNLPFREPHRVVVTVGRPRGEQYPDLAERIHDRIATRTGRTVGVQIRYVETDDVSA